MAATMRFVILVLFTCWLLLHPRDTCDAFVSPGKFLGAESSKMNDSFIDYLADVRMNEGTNWASVAKPNHTNNDDEGLNSYWYKLKTYQYSRLSDFNVSTAKSLSLFLHEFADAQVGVTEAKNIFSSISFDMRRIPSLEEQAQALADKFSGQLSSYHEALERMVSAVKSDQFRVGPPQIPKCCELKSEKFLYDEQYKMPIWKQSACWTVASKIKTNLFVPGLNFSQAIIRNSDTLPHLKWQYFVSPEGVYVEHPANSHNCKSTTTGTRTSSNSKGHPERKIWLIQKSKDDSRMHRIVFLIQLGQSPTLEMIKSVKNIVLMLMRFLDESDEVGILNAEPDQLWSNFLCDQLVPVTSWTRYQILSYLNYIEHRYKSAVSPSNSIGVDEEAGTSYGIEKAIQMACANFSETSLFPPSAATIIHLTSGIDLNSIAEKKLRVACPVFIETFFLKNASLSEEEQYKKSLQKAAAKNLWRVQVFSLNQTDPESFAVKVAFKLNSKKEWWSLSDILSQFFPQEKENSTLMSDFSLPHWNPISKEAVIVAKRYVFLKGRPLGLVAIEIPLVHFTQHISYFADENFCDSKNYAFLIDKSGRVISHPALGRPDVSEEALSPIQIEQVEIYPGFAILHRILLSVDSGCHSLRLRKEKSWVTYAWARVQDYVVVIVAFGESGGCVPDRESSFLRKSSLSPKSDVQHHLLLKKTHCCNNEAISTSKASLYLAPTAFEQPAEAIESLMSSKYNPKRSLAIMAFMSDNSGLLQNQNKGIKLAVKDHVGALANIVPTWKARFAASKWNKYILTRFATAAGGSFVLLHPGSSVTPGYVPRSSVWFRKAVIGDGKLIFSPPSIDAQGIPSSTMSVLINADIGSEATYTMKTVPVAVLGARVNVGFFQTVIEGILPECRNRTAEMSKKSTKEEDNISIRCFLLDDEGFVVYHPTLTRSLKHTPQIHVTQIEPLSVMDILQYGQNYKQVPMRKHTCHKLSEDSATQGSLQRMYTLSMSPEGIQKLKHGELCSFYHLIPVPNTNLFLGVVQDGCSSPAAFCPCSTVDRLCLNCLRIELTDCECPCECPREPNFCAKQHLDLSEDVEPCEFPAESLPLISREVVKCNKQLSSYNLNDTSCDDIRLPCARILNSEECIGSWNCDWCQPATGASASCVTYRECYNYGAVKFGTNGRPALDDLNDDALFALTDSPVDKMEDNSQITVVPILGVLSVFLVFLGLVVYCYRHRALSSSSSQPDVHLLPLQESPMGSVVPQAGSSRSESDNEADNVPLHMVYLQRNPRPPEPAFPYPPRSPLGSVVGTDSDFDHGYSTMHNDDSECGAPLPPPLVYLDAEPPPAPALFNSAVPRISLVESLTESYNTAAITANPTTHVAQVLVPVSVHEVSST